MKGAKSKTTKKSTTKEELSIEEKINAMDAKIKAKIEIHVTLINSLLLESEELTSKISKHENSKQDKARTIADQIGEIRKLVTSHNKDYEEDRKINLRKYLEILFEKDIRRINECEAISKATRHITKDPKRIKISTLIILGQALNSRDSKKIEIAKRTLSESKLPDGELLSSAKVTSIVKSLNHNSSEKVGKIYLRSVKTIIKNLDDKVTTINERKMKVKNEKDKSDIKKTTKTLIVSCNDIIEKLKIFSDEI